MSKGKPPATEPHSGPCEKQSVHTMLAQFREHATEKVLDGARQILDGLERQLDIVLARFEAKIQRVLDRGWKTA